LDLRLLWTFYDFLTVSFRLRRIPSKREFAMGAWMVTQLTRRDAYTLGPRVISGTHEEKLEQIEDEIQNLLKIKSLECGTANATHLAIPARSHWFAMMITIIVLLIALVVLLTATSARGVAPGARAGGRGEGLLAGQPRCCSR
jgi:hypothetical protein